MPIGLLGRKCGMSRVFTDEGLSIPVTIVEVTPNRVSQMKTVKNDKYRAMQIVAGAKKANKVTKPMQGHYAKAGVTAGNLLKEFRLNDDELPEVKVGDELTLELFNVGQAINVQGITRGKGFQGVIKRYNFHMQDATHGNSLSHRAPGSIGQCQTPGRVMPGKKMAGHMGNVNRTSPNLTVIRIDKEKNLIFIKGAVPGAPGGPVVITPCSNVVTKIVRVEDK